jgi:hypothetical protein
MELITVVIVLVIAGATIGLVFRARRHRAASRYEVDETSPHTSDAGWGAGSPEPMPPQVLSRDALVNPNRRLDPRSWDNRPDGTESDDDVPGELFDSDVEPDPLVLDRDFLARRRGNPDQRAGGDQSSEDNPSEDTPSDDDRRS